MPPGVQSLRVRRRRDDPKGLRIAPVSRGLALHRSSKSSQWCKTIGAIDVSDLTGSYPRSSAIARPRTSFFAHLSPMSRGCGRMVRGGFRVSSGSEKFSSGKPVLLPKSIWACVQRSRGGDESTTSNWLPDPPTFPQLHGSVNRQVAPSIRSSEYIDHAAQRQDPGVAARRRSHGYFILFIIPDCLLKRLNPRLHAAVRREFGGPHRHVYDDAKLDYTLKFWLDVSLRADRRGFAQDRRANRARDVGACCTRAGNSTSTTADGAGVGQQPFVGARASGTTTRPARAEPQTLVARGREGELHPPTDTNLRSDDE